MMAHITTKTATASPMMNNRTKGKFSPPRAPPLTVIEPASHFGAVTSTPIGPKMLRAACCKARLTPHVKQGVQRPPVKPPYQSYFEQSPKNASSEKRCHESKRECRSGRRKSQGQE